MSGHLDGPPPGPPDPPYIPGDMGAPSAEEFARRRASSEPRPEVRDCPLMHGAAPCPMCAYCPHGLTAGRGADERCLECGAAVTEPRPENPMTDVKRWTWASMVFCQDPAPFDEGENAVPIARWEDYTALVLVAEQLRDALRKIAHGPNSAPTTIEPWSRAEALIALRAPAASGVLKDGGPADA